MDADGAEAITHLVVNAEDALDVHVGLERGLDEVQLYAAPLGDRGNAGSQAARKTGEDEFYGSRSVVLGCKDFWMICLDGEGLVARLLRAEPEEFADRGAAVCTVQPLAACAPHELRSFRCPLKCFARFEQGSHINAVFHLRESRSARGH